jgi:para-aminobenzoate synthetase / 4-amino-4-deoxychorismate lyase
VNRALPPPRDHGQKHSSVWTRRLANQRNLVIIRDEPARRWLLFRQPKRVIAVHRCHQVLPQLEAIERRVDQENLWAAGFISYEAAPAFDPALRVRRSRGLPLIWFGLYDAPEVIELPDPGQPTDLESPAWRPSLRAQAYRRLIRQVKQRIQRGETYQVNFTLRLRGRIPLNPWDFFCRLAAAAPPPHAAFVSTDSWAVCSFSPELFFSLDRTTLVCRPMKGTARRGLSWEADELAAQRLAASPKERAENVMIVDMVRNDLGRIATTGTVNVRDLCRVERHPTVLQMTSTVQARSRAPWTRILQALFPPASVTGAPKAQTMRIIAALESTPRRLYTGCIGFLGPGRQARFNVAIRTALIQAGGKAEYGVGGGITWDSRPEAEWAEAMAKARVLLQPPRHFELIETLRWTAGSGYFLQDLHLRRLQQSAEYFAFAYNEKTVLAQLRAAVRGIRSGARRVRLLLSRDGQVTCQVSSLPPAPPPHPRRLALATAPIDSSDVFLYHKTTQRQVYENALAAAPGCDDVLLWNERGELTESCTANLILELRGERYTPPVTCGLLAGTYRAAMLRDGSVKERVLTRRDLRQAEHVYVANSVRGLQPAMLVGLQGGNRP